MFRIRAFEPQDADGVASLFRAYMREVYAGPSAMSAAVLLRDGQGRHFRLVIAVDATDAPAGFAAWRNSYDLHHAVRGAEIPDLFVARENRGRALSIRLVAEVAREVAARGGSYLKGEVLIDDRARTRLVHRVAVGFAGESVYISGRAFRELTTMIESDARDLLRKLPKPAMSREP